MIYLLCVLAPSASFAFAGNVPHCLTVEGLGLSAMQMHQGSGTGHVHSDGATHDHSGMHAGHDKLVGVKGVTHVAEKETSTPAKVPYKSSEAQCCGLLCLTALPATLIDFVTPALVTFVCESESHRNLADNTPPQRYRPPIS